MVTPANLDITIEQNATFSMQCDFKDSTGVALNMNSYTVAAQLWTEAKGRKLADFTVTWVNRASGQFTISLSAAVTAALGASGYWDLLVTNPDGTKDYWLRGAATLEAGYTL
jgi:predicted phosphatase